MSHPRQPQPRKRPVLNFLKVNWWKILIALAVLGIGVALCVTGIGSLLGLPLITSIIAGSITMMSSLGTLGASALIVSGALAVIGGAAFIIGKIVDAVRHKCRRCDGHSRAEQAPVVASGVSSTAAVAREVPLDKQPSAKTSKRSAQTLTSEASESGPQDHEALLARNQNSPLSGRRK